ncbi:MAG: NUDIX domain-containing protein [Actinomycetota bacterium]
MDAEKDVEIISKETVFQGYFRMDRYRLRHRRFDGGWTHEIIREVFERGHAVVVILYDPDLDRVVMVEQFRTGAYAAGWDPWQVEFVAGIIEEGESPAAVALRETEEESGCTPLDMIEVGAYSVTAGGSSETARLFCARVDSSKAGGLHGLIEEGEDIRVLTLSTDEALALLRQGRITNAMAAVGIQWLVLERDNLRARWSR